MRYTQKEKRRKQNIINNVHEPLAVYGPEGKNMLFLGSTERNAMVFECGSMSVAYYYNRGEYNA